MQGHGYQQTGAICHTYLPFVLPFLSLSLLIPSLLPSSAYCQSTMAQELRQALGIVDLRKKVPTKKGFWWLNGLKFSKSEPSSHFCPGASHTNCTLWRSLCTRLPACTVCLPAEPALIKEFLESYFSQ